MTNDPTTASKTNPVVLITGASTGIGKDIALRLASLNYTIIAGIRNEKDGKRLLKEAGSFSDNLLPTQLDVTSTSDMDRLLETHQFLLESRGLSALINNAGIAVGGPMECLPLHRFQAQMDINVNGVLTMTQACLPYLREKNARKPQQNTIASRIINISSIAGLSTIPFMGAYSASKHALEAISNAFRMELKPWGVHVVLIEPGPIATPIWEKSLDSAEGLTKGIPPEKLELYNASLKKLVNVTQKSAKNAIPVHHVTDVVLESLTHKKPKARYLVGKSAKLRHRLRFLPDHWMDYLVLKKIGI